MSSIDDSDQYLADSINITPEFLQEEFVRVPSDLYHWNRKFADAQKELYKAKLITKQTFAERWHALKNYLIEKNGKASIDDIKNAIELDDTMQEVRATEIEAEYERDKLKGVVESIRAKHDMIISLGATIRQEIGKGPSINR